MILCRSVHKYITFCSEPLIRTLIRRIKCRISASQTFITYTMRIKSANITQKNKIFLFFFKNGCLLICLRIFIRISTVSYSSHSHQRSQHNYCRGSTRVLTTMSPLSAAAALPRFGTPRHGTPARKPAMRTSPLRWKTLTFNKQDDTTWNFHISPYCCSPAWMG